MKAKHIKKKKTFTMAEYMLTCDITTAGITQILFQYIITKIAIIHIGNNIFCREESFIAILAIYKYTVDRNVL